MREMKGIGDNRTIPLLLFIGYNVLCFFIVQFILSFMYTYINAMFIPDQLRWTGDGTLKTDLTMFGVWQTALFNIEAIILLIVLYLVNRLYNNKFMGLNDRLVLIPSFIIYLILLIESILMYRSEYLFS